MFKLPDGIDPRKAVGELADDELRSLASSIIGQMASRRTLTSKEARRVSSFRKKRMSKTDRRRVAKTAAAARWAKNRTNGIQTGQNAADPPV